MKMLESEEGEGIGKDLLLAWAPAFAELLSG